MGVFYTPATGNSRKANAQKSCKPRDKENTKYKINVTLSKKKNAATTINGKTRETEREDNMNNNKFRNEKENQRST